MFESRLPDHQEVAQPVRARRWGRRGRELESRLPDHREEVTSKDAELRTGSGALAYPLGRAGGKV